MGGCLGSWGFFATRIRVVMLIGEKERKKL